jgi:transcriptional regulator with XRE-family HTH domain
MRGDVSSSYVPRVDDNATIGRRLTAARQIAGLTRDQLAARIDTGKLGYQTIGKIERGERRLERHEAPMFAAALDVSPEFFYATDEPAASDIDLSGLEAQLAKINNHLAGMETRRADAFADLYARVQRNERMLEEILNLLRTGRDGDAADPLEVPGPVGDARRDLLDGQPNETTRGQERTSDQSPRRKRAS